LLLMRFGVKMYSLSFACQYWSTKASYCVTPYRSSSVLDRRNRLRSRRLPATELENSFYCTGRCGGVVLQRASTSLHAPKGVLSWMKLLSLMLFYNHNWVTAYMKLLEHC
jgi:hypothetical protein